jgi:hypothetical protein
VERLSEDYLSKETENTSPKRKEAYTTFLGKFPS